MVSWKFSKPPGHNYKRWNTINYLATISCNIKVKRSQTVLESLMEWILWFEDTNNWTYYNTVELTHGPIIRLHDEKTDILPTMLTEAYWLSIGGGGNQQTKTLAYVPSKNVFGVRHSNKELIQRWSGHGLYTLLDKINALLVKMYSHSIYFLFLLLFGYIKHFLLAFSPTFPIYKWKRIIKIVTNKICGGFFVQECVKDGVVIAGTSWSQNLNQSW